MRYAPSAEAAGHVNPRNHLDWVVGCLGVVPTCSAQCATSFGACMDVHVLAAAPLALHVAFDVCIAPTIMQALAGCVARCAPSLSMLQRAQPTSSLALNLGSFGSARHAVNSQPAGSQCISFDARPPPPVLRAEAPPSAGGIGVAAAIGIGASGLAAAAILILTARWWRARRVEHPCNAAAA